MGGFVLEQITIGLLPVTAGCTRRQGMGYGIWDTYLLSIHHQALPRWFRPLCPFPYSLLAWVPFGWLPIASRAYTQGLMDLC